MKMSRDGNRHLREEKIKKIFDTFDTNKDDHLSLSELVAWIMAVDSDLSNNIKRIPDILLEYIRGHEVNVYEQGLSYIGFRLIYKHKKRDLDRDLHTLIQFQKKKKNKYLCNSAVQIQLPHQRG